MYHTRNLSFVFCLDRQTIAPVSHSNDGILQHRTMTVEENAKLFIDFVLSQEVQNILCNDLDLRPVRDDISYPEYFRPASDIKTVALDQQYVNEHKAEIVDKFTEVYQGTF